MPSVEALRLDALRCDAATFEARWGAAALVTRPDSVLLDRAALSVAVPPTMQGRPADGQFRELLLMLRQFRQLEVLFLRAGEGRRVIGRSPTCAVALSDGSVSKEHAGLVASPAGWRVEDLASRNGTAVNGVPVRGLTLLGDGDNLRLGDVQFVFVKGTTLHAQLCALG